MARPTISENDPDWYAESEVLLDYFETAKVAAEAHASDTTGVHGIPDGAVLATDTEVTNAIAAHATDQTNVHGIADAAQLATTDDLNAVSAILAGGVPFDATEAVTTGEVRVYRGGLWEALEDLPANTPPLGSGDGSLGDQLLLLARRSGFADWVTGGFGETVFTVTNQNDTGSGSLRAQVTAAKAAGGGWIIFNPAFNGGVYNITLGSHFQIAGLGAQNITIDGRGATVTINAGGTPDASENGGATGFLCCIGGRTFADYSAGGNTTPASNIIICNIALVSDFGGDDLGSDGGASEDDFAVRYWARGIWLDHMTMTNPDRYHDGLLDVSYGATEITVSWSYLHHHHKALLINDNLPGDSGGLTLPAGITVGAPGPYEIFVDPVGSVPRVVTKVTHHHNLKRHLADRSGYAKTDAVRYHAFNEWVDGWGAYKDTAGTFGPVDEVYQEHEGFPVGITGPNSGSGYKVVIRGQGVIESNVITPWATADAGSPAMNRGIDTDEGTRGYVINRDNLFEDGSSGEATVNEGLCFSPSDFYSYTPEAPAGLKPRLTLAAGAGHELWSYLGAAPVVTTVDVQQDGIDLGVGATQSPADTFNFTGTGVTATYEPTTRVAEVAVELGAADPTTFLDYISTLPTPDAGHDHEYAFDSTAGRLYQCIFVVGPNTWQWLPVAPPNTPLVIPGQEIAHIVYWPTSTQTTATTTSTTMTDITAEAIVAAWTGVAAATFDAVFTVPPSEAVVVRISALVSTVASGKQLYFGLYDVGGAAAITNSKEQITNSGSIMRCTYEKRLGSAELTAIGTSFTVRPQWADTSAGTGSIFTGAQLGPFRHQVFASL